MEIIKHHDHTDVDYMMSQGIEIQLDNRELLRLGLSRLNKADLKNIMQRIVPWSKSAINQMKANEMRQFIEERATEKQVAEIRQNHPMAFALQCKDANRLFNLHLKPSQTEYLARVGKLQVVGLLHSTHNDYEAQVYLAESFLGLTSKDLCCPDVPDWVTKTALLRRFGWTKAMIARFLPEPRLMKARRVFDPPYKLWRIEDITNAEQKDEFHAYMLGIAHRRKAASLAGEKRMQAQREALCRMVDEKVNSYEVPQFDAEFCITVYDFDEEEVAKGEHFRQWMATAIESLEWDAFSMTHGLAGGRKEQFRYYNAIIDKFAKTYPEYSGLCKQFRKQVS